LLEEVSLGNDTPKTASAKMSKTYQLYIKAKDGDVIKFNQQKFVKGKHRKVVDFLLKKIIHIHANDNRRREGMKIRAHHQSRSSVPSHDETTVHLDKLIKRKEMELPLIIGWMKSSWLRRGRIENVWQRSQR
jgi:hypothetical protein